MTPTSSLVCVTEDRASEAVALSLLIASLAEHCPDLPVAVWFPPATDSFVRWALAAASPASVLSHRSDPRCDGLERQATRAFAASGGGRMTSVSWIDSDVILTGDFRRALPSRRRETLVIARRGPRSAGNGGSRPREPQAWTLGAARVLDDSCQRVRSARDAGSPRAPGRMESHARRSLRMSRRRPDRGPSGRFVSAATQHVLTALLSSSAVRGVPLAWLDVAATRSSSTSGRVDARQVNGAAASGHAESHPESMSKEATNPRRSRRTAGRACAERSTRSVAAPRVQSRALRGEAPRHAGREA